MSKQVEQYLNQLRSQLKRLPAEQREAEVEEIHQHLLALIEYRVEQGEELEMATAEAIKQFGTPQANGKALRKTWRRGEFLANGRLVARLHLWVAGVIFHLLVGIFPPAGVFKYYDTYLYWPYYLLTSRFEGYNFDTWWACLAQLVLSLFAAASLSAPRKYRAVFLGVMASLSLYRIATVLPLGKVVSPVGVNYYLATQMLAFALSSWGVWLAVKRGETPLRAR